jgi:hypothetical protein
LRSALETYAIDAAGRVVRRASSAAFAVHSTDEDGQREKAMTIKDKLEIGLKEDAPYRKDNLPEAEVRGPEIPTGPGRSPEIPAARGDKSRVGNETSPAKTSDGTDA